MQLENGCKKGADKMSKFCRTSDQKVILLHKPHPGDIMRTGAVKQLVEYLMQIGEL